MAHAVHTRDLGRNRSWRKATVRSLAQAVIKSERIQTTQAKAKEAQRVVERLITLGKKGTLSSRRRARQIIDDPALVRRLFTELAPRFEKRAGGYTRILHNGFRAGDGASMVVLEFVELSELRQPKVIAREKKAEEPPEQAPEAEQEGAQTPPTEVSPEVTPAEEPKPEAAPKSKKAPKPKAAPKKKPKQEKKPERLDAKEAKPKGFLGGLRKFFKRRENP